MCARLCQPVGWAVFAECLGFQPSANGTRVDPSGFRGEAPAVSGRTPLAGRASPGSRSAPSPLPRTCCVLKSQPRQQRRPARSATVLGVPAARLCVRASMCPAGGQAGGRRDCRCALSPRDTKARLPPRPPGLWTGVTRRDCPVAPPAGRSRVGLHLSGALGGRYWCRSLPCRALASLQVCTTHTHPCPDIK